eukprot:GHVS01046433.1.p1 GENE.GHVS01046433.1~~GHVS01046433.1.p1  ORF type:complete len:108 (-),score=14.43 GHVS01046433.1:175-498(-)
MCALFCPTCNNILLVRSHPSVQFYCRSCPYLLSIRNKIVSKSTVTTTKQLAKAEDKDDMSRGSKTQVVCPECNHQEAYFFQVQIRSGDEPMTSFFCCCKCDCRWREG